MRNYLALARQDAYVASKLIEVNLFEKLMSHCETQFHGSFEAFKS